MKARGRGVEGDGTTVSKVSEMEGELEELSKCGRGKLTQSCSARQCRLRRNVFEECADRRWGVRSSYLVV